MKADNNNDFLIYGKILLPHCSHLWEDQLSLNVKSYLKKKYRVYIIYVIVTGKWMFSASVPLFDDLLKQTFTWCVLQRRQICQVTIKCLKCELKVWNNW